jgi:O-antigen ligase
MIIMALLLTIFAFSRASLLGISITIIIYLFYYHKKLFNVTALLAVIVIIVVLLSPLLLELLKLADNPLSQRDKIWDLALNEWKKHKVFGAGYGTALIFTDQKYLLFRESISIFLLGKRFNNIYIELLFEIGIIGLIMYFFVIFYMIRKVRQVMENSKSNDRLLSICYFALLIAVIVQSFFESFVLSAGNISSMIFWILTGIVFSIQTNEEVGANTHRMNKIYSRSDFQE